MVAGTVDDTLHERLAAGDLGLAEPDPEQLVHERVARRRLDADRACADVDDERAAVADRERLLEDDLALGPRAYAVVDRDGLVGLLADLRGFDRA